MMKIFVNTALLAMFLMISRDAGHQSLPRAFAKGELVRTRILNRAEYQPTDFTIELGPSIQTIQTSSKTLIPTSGIKKRYPISENNPTDNDLKGTIKSSYIRILNRVIDEIETVSGRKVLVEKSYQILRNAE